MKREETLTIHEYAFTVFYEPAEEGGYVVTCPALPAVVTQGETLEEARAMAAPSIHSGLQSLINHGEPVPADRVAEREPRPIRETLTVAIQGV